MGSVTSFVDQTYQTNITDQQLNDIVEKIKEHSKIVIFTHINPDGDCNGSAFGLRQLIWDNVDKSKQIKVVGVDCPKNLAFAGKYDDVSDDFVKQALAVIVDTSTAVRVSDQRFHSSVYKIKIDHHVDSPDFADINVVEHLPSCAEIIAIMGWRLGWKMSKAAALPLLVGVITDTGRFRHLRNRAVTFTIAAKLAAGIDLQKELYGPLYERDPAELAFTGWYLRHIKIFGGVAYVIVDKKVIERFNVDLAQIPAWISNMRDLAGVKVWAQFIEYPDYWRCEYRSSGYPVNELAGLFGGGGHKQASGSQASSLQQVRKIIAHMQKIDLNRY